MSLAAWVSLLLFFLITPIILLHFAVMPALNQLKYTYESADTTARHIIEQ